MKNKDIVITIALFYLGWFGNVVLARTAFSMVSLIFPLGLIAFLWFNKSLTSKSFILAAVVSAIGILFDFLLLHFGFVDIYGDTLLFIPTWLISIWILYSFSIIKLGPLLNFPLGEAIILGVIFGPLSYKSGEAFQVLTFSTSMTFFIYAIFWAIMFPLVITLTKRII